MTSPQQSPCVLLHVTAAMKNRFGYPSQLHAPWRDRTVLEHTVDNIRASIEGARVVILTSDSRRDDCLVGRLEASHVEIIRIPSTRPWAPGPHNVVEIHWPWMYRIGWGAYHVQGMQHCMDGLAASSYVLLNADACAFFDAPSLRSLWKWANRRRAHLYSFLAEFALIFPSNDFTRQWDMLSRAEVSTGDWHVETLHYLARHAGLGAQRLCNGDAFSILQPFASPTDRVFAGLRKRRGVPAGDAPRVIHLEITANGVDGAPDPAATDGAQEMSIRMFRGILEELSPAVTVIHLGVRGDPLLHSAYREMLTMLHRLGFRSCVETRIAGLLAVDPESFAKVCPDVLILKINESERDRDAVREWMRHVRATSSERAEAMHVCFEWEAWTRAQHVIDRVHALWEDMDGRLVLKPFHEYPGRRDIPESAYRQPVAHVHPLCRQLEEGMVVVPNGRIPLCRQDPPGGRPLGDLRESSLMEIWRSPGLHRKRAHYAAGRFEECSAWCASCAVSDVSLAPRMFAYRAAPDRRRRDAARLFGTARFLDPDALTDRYTVKGLQSPSDVYIHAADHDMWVADFTGNKIFRLSPRGVLKQSLDVPGPVRIHGVQGDIVVVSHAKGRLYRIDGNQVKKMLVPNLRDHVKLWDLAASGEELYCLVSGGSYGAILRMHGVAGRETLVDSSSVYSLARGRWFAKSPCREVFYVDVRDGLHAVSASSCKALLKEPCTRTLPLPDERLLILSYESLLLLDTDHAHVEREIYPLPFGLVPISMALDPDRKTLWLGYMPAHPGHAHEDVGIAGVPVDVILDPPRMRGTDDARHDA